MCTNIQAYKPTRRHAYTCLHTYTPTRLQAYMLTSTRTRTQAGMSNPRGARVFSHGFHGGFSHMFEAYVFIIQRIIHRQHGGCASRAPFTPYAPPHRDKATATPGRPCIPPGRPACGDIVSAYGSCRCTVSRTPWILWTRHRHPCSGGPGCTDGVTVSCPPTFDARRHACDRRTGTRLRGGCGPKRSACETR